MTAASVSFAVPPGTRHPCAFCARPTGVWPNRDGVLVTVKHRDAGARGTKCPGSYTVPPALGGEVIPGADVAPVEVNTKPRRRRRRTR